MISKPPGSEAPNEFTIKVIDTGSLKPSDTPTKNRRMTNDT